MELNFEGGSLQYYERVCSAAYSCEETTELIVPDTLPDAAEILMADGQTFLRGKEARPGALAISGVSEVTVLYRPEEGGVRQLKLEVPFEGENPCPGLTETDRLTACVHLVSAEARILNSRKLLVRTEVCILACAWQPRELAWAERSPDAALELKMEKRSLFPVTEVTEKTFDLSETLPLPAGKPPAGELLCCRVSLQQEEANPVGGRLILRGTAFLSAVYLSMAGELAEAELRSPWSAVLELPAGDAEVKCVYTPAITGFSASLSEGGIDMDLGGVVQAAVHRRMDAAYISDAYAVERELTVHTESRTLTADCAQLEQTDVLTLRLEGKQTPRSLTALFADCGRPRQEKELWRVPVTVKALCMGESGPVLLTGRGEAVCRSLSAPVLRTGELYASVSAAGAEVRVPVIFSGEQEEQAALSFVTGAELAETEEAPNRLTAVLLRTRPGDTIWALGKRKKLPCSAIRSINGLDENEEPAPGTLLLLAK